MVASEATKTELSDTIDTMIEEVSLFFLEQTCPLFYDSGIVQPEKNIYSISCRSIPLFTSIT